MAGNDPQNQLFTLIRDFASEKSQGEHRVANLKKQIQGLRSELDSANREIEEAKSLKEATEQELKGYEVELAVIEASLQALGGRIVLIQDEISAIGTDLDALKSEEGAARDKFLGEMFELNAKIRKFQESRECHRPNEDNGGELANVGPESSDMEAMEMAKGDLEKQLAQIISQISKEEEVHKIEQDNHKLLMQELSELQRKTSLMEAIMRESTELQELSKQTSALEESCAILGEELQKKCLCPKCQKDNSEELGGLLQKSDGS